MNKKLRNSYNSKSYELFNVDLVCVNKAKKVRTVKRIKTYEYEFDACGFFIMNTNYLCNIYGAKDTPIP